MIEEIIRMLGDNYDINDNQVLNDIINEVSYSALSITNKTSIDGLEDIIKRAVIKRYLIRGGEGTKSSNELGTNLTFENVMEEMKRELIVEGKRRIW